MAAPEDTGMTALGTIVKAHGLDGGIIVDPKVDSAEFEKITRIFIRDRRGDLIPYQVENSRLDRKKGRETFFVKLAFINDRTTAEDLAGSSIFTEEEIPELLPEVELPDVLDWQVFDVDQQQLGVVSEIMDSPAHPIISVSGEIIGELLIPWVDEYIAEVDEENNVVVAKNIDRLIPDE